RAAGDVVEDHRHLGVEGRDLGCDPREVVVEAVLVRPDVVRGDDSTPSTPSSTAWRVSSRVSSRLFDPVPGTNGTRPATRSLTNSTTALRSSRDCELGSPVVPVLDRPWLPFSFWNSITRPSAT